MNEISFDSESDISSKSDLLDAQSYEGSFMSLDANLEESESSFIV